MATINELLITFEDIQSYIPDVANNLDRREIEPYILDVQRFELSQLIGSALYRECYLNQLQTTPTDYVTLINGGTYQDCNNHTVDYYGLKPFLAYAVYARVITSSNVKITRSGPMSNTNPYANRVQGGELKTHLDMANQKSAFYKQNILEFLCASEGLYPLKTCCNTNSVMPRTQAFVVTAGYIKYPDQGSRFWYY